MKNFIFAAALFQLPIIAVRRKHGRWSLCDVSVLKPSQHGEKGTLTCFQLVWDLNEECLCLQLQELCAGDREGSVTLQYFKVKRDTGHVKDILCVPLCVYVQS